jgi:hypothetical protein
LHTIRSHGQHRDANVQFRNNDLLLQFARKNQHSKTPFKAEKSAISQHENTKLPETVNTVAQKKAKQNASPESILYKVRAVSSRIRENSDAPKGHALNSHESGYKQTHSAACNLY